MSAPSIPNLNSLRRSGRGGSRGDLSGRTNQIDEDAVIRSTDGDASSSRVSAVEAGYLDDPFAKYLADENWQRRLPLMNRGTYVRTTAIDRIVDTFLSSIKEQKQIISLGAGSDTRYFRLKREKKHTNFFYHELDFEENNKTKINRLQTAQCVQKVKDLCDVDLKAFKTTNGEMWSPEYSIHAIDLRKPPEKPEWLETTIPTLLVSECCLIYLSPDKADGLLTYFSGLFTSAPLSIVIYEPFRPYDPFGRTMIKNLTTRGIVLQTIEKYSDLDQQQHRLDDHGFSARVADTSFIWQKWIAQEEKDRVDKLEWLDEVEEFELLARHYCVSWAWRHFAETTGWQNLLAQSTFSEAGTSSKA